MLLEQLAAKKRNGIGKGGHAFFRIKTYTWQTELNLETFHKRCLVLGIADFRPTSLTFFSIRVDHIRVVSLEVLVHPK